MWSIVYKSIDEINAREWNSLSGETNPFVRHEFLAALEHTHCVGAGTGWEPCYFTRKDSQALAGAVPAFRKSHSYGEFVFDFAWAQAYARFGNRYYPKLTVAVPFTPATGPRLLVRADLDQQTLARRLLSDIEAYTTSHSLSSVHALFLDEPAHIACEQAGWLIRRDWQFHWADHD